MNAERIGEAAVIVVVAVNAGIILAGVVYEMAVWIQRRRALRDLERCLAAWARRRRARDA